MLRADRADGIIIKNLTAEQASFNGIDVVETNGFILQKTIGRYNQNYGMLTFTSDNGLYDGVEGYGNGGSPGSGPEGHCQRYGIEIRNSGSHDNVLGQSGTAGNGTYVHDSKWFNNGTGIVNDSSATGHPGMPQTARSGRTTRSSRTTSTSSSRTTRSTAPPRRSTSARASVLFWVPGAVRGDNSQQAQRDTSHRNRITGNTFGIAPDGRKMPNGVDIFWDEQGDGNCFEENTGIGGKVTMDPVNAPTCRSGGSFGAVSNPDKIGPEVPCATWDPKDNPDPPGCTWFDTSAPDGPHPLRNHGGRRPARARVGRRRGPRARRRGA